MDEIKEFKKALIDNNMSVADFAKSIGYTRQYVYAVLAGRQRSYEIERLIREYTRANSR